MKKLISAGAAMLLAVLWLTTTGCQTQHTNPVDQAAAMSGQNVEAEGAEAMLLREGDVLKISFPGSPSLDTTQAIRRDGKISMQLVGEITASGITPADLQKEIAKAYGTQLVSKEVTVTVVSSSIPVFVTGSVLRPQKVVSDHPISALEAIMEAGGFDYSKANLKDVRVIRYEDGRQHIYFLNLRDVMQGKKTAQFFLKPFDIIVVPERFSMF